MTTKLRILAMFAMLIALVFACNGCAGREYDLEFISQPDQDLAQHIVWDLAFGNDKVVPVKYIPPLVQWRYNDSCDGHDGWEHNGFCILGYYAPDRQYAEVEWLGKFSSSPYAHELCHAWKLYTAHDMDQGHLSDCYEQGGLVDLANALLQQKGL